MPDGTQIASLKFIWYASADSGKKARCLVLEIFVTYFWAVVVDVCFGDEALNEVTSLRSISTVTTEKTNLHPEPRQ